MEKITGVYGYEYKINLHFHSLLSDGAYGISKLSKIAENSDFDVLSLTDHNEIRNSIHLQDRIKDKIIILGSEISTSDGMEVLIYFRHRQEFHDFFSKYAKHKKHSIRGPHIRIKLLDLLEKIKGYDVLLGVPHPYGKKGIVKRLYKKKYTTRIICAVMKRFDFYEIINGTQSAKNNRKSLKWFNTNRPDLFPLGASDFHRNQKSFNTTGTVVKSKVKLDLDNFFTLVKSRSPNLMFSPYGKSMRHFQKIWHNLHSGINYLRTERNKSH